jgi:serine protease Do
LADLLRKLLADFDLYTPQPARHLGLILEPAHVARARRGAVGLPDATGLLVAEVAPDTPAARAGLQRGDLLTGIGAVQVHSSIELALQMEAIGKATSFSLRLLRGEERFSVRLATRN